MLSVIWCEGEFLRPSATCKLPSLSPPSTTPQNPLFFTSLSKSSLHFREVQFIFSSSSKTQVGLGLAVKISTFTECYVEHVENQILVLPRKKNCIFEENTSSRIRFSCRKLGVFFLLWVRALYLMS